MTEDKSDSIFGDSELPESEDNTAASNQDATAAPLPSIAGTSKTPGVRISTSIGESLAFLANADAQKNAVLMGVQLLAGWAISTEQKNEKLQSKLDRADTNIAELSATVSELREQLALCKGRHEAHSHNRFLREVLLAIGSGMVGLGIEHGWKIVGVGLVIAIVGYLVDRPSRARK